MRNRIIIAGLILLAVLAAGIALYANMGRDEPAPAPVVAPVAPARGPAPIPDPEPAAPAAAPRPPQMGTAFIDRFDGAGIDPRWFVSDGWANGDYMENDWRASQVALTPEGLAMTLARAKGDAIKPFSSGELQTHERFRYGWFEVRMRIPKGPGLVTGVFTYAGAGEAGAPNEIDIEITGQNTRRIEMTYHQTNKPSGETARMPFDAAEGFHTFAFEWLPDTVRWYADGVLLREAAGAGVERLKRPQALMIHQWASVKLAPWVGTLNPDGGPWTLTIACVAYAPEKPVAPLCD